MVKTTEELKFELRRYKDPVNKIHRMIQSEELIPLIKGVYETSRKSNPFVLARIICSPSYISFESALSYHGMIPERVYAITSASLNKRKDKIFENDFGTFIYKDIPERVFPYGVVLIRAANGYKYRMATKEKALCDKLYKLRPINSFKQLESVLFDDLRIDEDVLNEFNMNDMEIYANKYHSKNVDILYRYLRRRIS